MFLVGRQGSLGLSSLDEGVVVFINQELGGFFTTINGPLVHVLQLKSSVLLEKSATFVPQN
jgi:hypothetical protein